MGWDASRPVPWKRFVRDWLVYAVLMGVVLTIVSRERVVVTMIAVAVSLPVYLVIAGVFAKFGYVRKTFAEQRAISEARRAQRAAAKSGAPATTAAPPQRVRPAPTRRTTTGPSQRPRRTGKDRRR